MKYEDKLEGELDAEMIVEMDKRLNDPNAKFIDDDDFMNDDGHYKLIDGEVVVSQEAFFEEFLHLFFNGGDERPFDQEYYHHALVNGDYEILTENGERCTNQKVYKALKAKLEWYDYRLDGDILRKS
jgi:hypothetical protein